MKKLSNDQWTIIFNNMKEMKKEDRYDGAEWIETIWLDGTNEWCLAYGEELFEDGFKTEHAANDRLNHLENVLL